jgi:membrane peptidoglycan carboxypeptidase
MDNIPEFRDDGVPRVQGGTYPARIWGAFMERAHVFEPITDWAPPPPPTRPAVRLYLPGNECLFNTVTEVVTPVPTATTLPGADLGGASEVAEQEESPPGDEITEPATPDDTTPTTVVTRTVRVPVESGTTIAPDVLDPNAPIPSVPPNVTVAPC